MLTLLTQPHQIYVLTTTGTSSLVPKLNDSIILASKRCGYAPTRAGSATHVQSNCFRRLLYLTPRTQGKTTLCMPTPNIPQNSWGISCGVLWLLVQTNNALVCWHTEAPPPASESTRESAPAIVMAKG